MGIFPDDLEQVYDNVTGHKLHSSSKTGRNNAKWSPSHSMSVPE